MTYAKNHSAIELNRIRITKRYRNHLLTRPSMENSTQTIVAIGLGIIEVAGIDPQKQVSRNKQKFFLRVRCVSLKTRLNILIF
jgi:hypothetical protein